MIELRWLQVGCPPFDTVLQFLEEGYEWQDVPLVMPGKGIVITEKSGETE